MTSIDSTAQLSALIRTALRNGAGGVAQRSVTSTKGPQESSEDTLSGLPSSTERDATTVEGFDRQLLERIKQISVHDPLRRKKAFVFFLESVLMNELGGSPGIQYDVSRLAEEAASRMHADAELASQVEDAGGLLLELAGVVAV